MTYENKIPLENKKPFEIVQVDIHKNGKRVDTTTSYEDSCSIM